MTAPLKRGSARSPLPTRLQNPQFSSGPHPLARLYLSNNCHNSFTQYGIGCRCTDPGCSDSHMRRGNRCSQDMNPQFLFPERLLQDYAPDRVISLTKYDTSTVRVKLSEGWNGESNHYRKRELHELIEATIRLLLSSIYTRKEGKDEMNTIWEN